MSDSVQRHVSAQSPPAEGELTILSLHGRHSSAVIELDRAAGPIWRYWGHRLPVDASPGWALHQERTAPTSVLDPDPALSVFPSFGFGWFAPSALLAHRQGVAFAQAFERFEARWLDPARHLLLSLEDPEAGIRVELELQLDPCTDILSLRSCLHNVGVDTLELQWLAAATLPLPEPACHVRFYSGQHNQEFVQQDEVLSRSQWRRENRRGRTSHDCFPGALVYTAGTTDHEGPVWAAHLAWSGNHQQSIDALSDSRRQWQWGEWLAPGEARLAPGERWTTPTVLACYSPAGFNGAAACFHAEARRRLDWPDGVAPDRPVHLNTWEAVYFDVQPQALAELAQAAAAVGVERFVLDDGWFHGRRDDSAGLGDWWPDARKFPDGLAALADQVRGLGMAFGLWVEPEMISPHSELYRAHPDWALQVRGKPQILGRNQLVLDLGRAEVAEHLWRRLDGLLSSLPITYLKWDHNRDLATAADALGRATYRRQVDAYYALLERLRRAHPRLEIESCAAGGARIDFGVLRHVRRFWTSDCNDALARLSIQRGFLQFFPPEVMGAHIGPAIAHTTGRQHSLAFRAGVALPGHLGIEADLRALTPEARRELAAWIGLYKRLRTRLHRGQVWHGQAGDSLLWQLHGDPGGAQWLLLVARPQPSALKYPPPLRLPMLEAAATYRVALCRPDGGFASAPHPAHEALFSAETRFSGAWLQHSGLPLPAQAAETVQIFEIGRLPHSD